MKGPDGEKLAVELAGAVVMRWTGRLSREERAARDEALLAALAHASSGGSEWTTADAVVRALGPEHRALPPEQRMTAQGAGRVLAELAYARRCERQTDYISRYRSKAVS